MNTADTIVAIASATAAAPRLIVRTSGASAIAIARSLGVEPSESPGVWRGTLRVRDFEFQARAYLFRNPRSYTGEDQVEFHVPGNVLLVRHLMDECVRLGARRAEPGEFTARAYFNGRMDLPEAEGVQATIAASNEQELRAARQLLSGELAKRLRPVTDAVAEALALLEVGIDFSDEDVTFISPAELARRLTEADSALERLVAESARFERLSAEPTVVLVGRPNAGKSTLLNALAGTDRAVVSPVAGTTRDALSAEVALPRGMIRVVDVAGIEAASTSDAIERDMQRRALETMQAADVLVHLHASDDEFEPLDVHHEVDLRVMTKADLACQPVKMGYLPVSAHSGAGMETLRENLDDLVFGRRDPGTLALNARHLAAISAARTALSRCLNSTQDLSATELIALELREALDALGSILGSISPDEVLSRVFSRFCIGK